MALHLLLPNITLQPGLIANPYRSYLEQWRQSVIDGAERGSIAASECVQAAILDVCMFGGLRHAWLDVADALLQDGVKPLAYSTAYGTRLYGFEAQAQQSTIHAIHARWWIESQVRPQAIDHARYATMVTSKRQSNGLIYDFDVSPTILRHRMKSEVLLSMAMAVDILSAAGQLDTATAASLAAVTQDPQLCPPLNYLSMESFRLAALTGLGHAAQYVRDTAPLLAVCMEGLDVGWCDFAMREKVDAYMGTAKRVGRDRAIHSPLMACHAAVLAPRIQSASDRVTFRNRMTAYQEFLRANPMSIPAFQMRDLPFPFGADLTPLEAIAASHLLPPPSASTCHE